MFLFLGCGYVEIALEVFLEFYYLISKDHKGFYYQKLFAVKGSKRQLMN